MNVPYLSISSLFLLFPLILFVYKNQQNIYETILAGLLLINIVLSFLFWQNPIKNSTIHFYDGIFGKISFLFCCIYVLFVKELEQSMKLIFIALLIATLILFYYSNDHSTKNWYSKEHIMYHFAFHSFMSIGCCIAFI
jgi:hypothetical protein